jgi:hypothetical protein
MKTRYSPAGLTLGMVPAPLPRSDSAAACLAQQGGWEAVVLPAWDGSKTALAGSENLAIEALYVGL